MENKTSQSLSTETKLDTNNSLIFFKLFSFSLLSSFSLESKSWPLWAQMESSMTLCSDSFETGWRRAVERPYTWLGWALVRNTHFLNKLQGNSKCMEDLFFFWVGRWWWLGSEWDRYGSISSNSALHVWATRCWPYTSKRPQRGCWVGAWLSDSEARGRAGFLGSQVSSQVFTTPAHK